MKLYGKAVVHGAPGVVSFTGAASTTLKHVGTQLTDQFAVSKAVDGDNNVFAMAVSAHSRQAVFRIIPFDGGETPTLSTAKSNIKLPAPGAVVTFASSGVTLMDGSWNYVGPGTITTTPEGFVELVLTCEQQGDDGTTTPGALAAI